jgi:hypothetical protein
MMPMPFACVIVIRFGFSQEQKRIIGLIRNQSGWMGEKD